MAVVNAGSKSYYNCKISILQIHNSNDFSKLSAEIHIYSVCKHTEHLTMGRLLESNAPVTSYLMKHMHSWFHLFKEMFFMAQSEIIRQLSLKHLFEDYTEIIFKIYSVLINQKTSPNHSDFSEWQSKNYTAPNRNLRITSKYYIS